MSNAIFELEQQILKCWNITDWKGRCSELAFEIERLWKEVEEWKQQNKSLLKDQERLEWLVKDGCYPMETRDGWCLTDNGQCRIWDIPDQSSWRDAIDEAMRGE